MSINSTTNNNIALTKHTYVYFYTYTSDCQLQYRFTIKSHLRHCGIPNHFLMYELINTSSLSTVVKETSYTISGHNNLGNRPNWKHQSFSLPGRAQLFMLFNPSTACRLTSPTQAVSFRSPSYHNPRLFTGFSETFGIASPLMKNVLSTTFPTEILLDLRA